MKRFAGGVILVVALLFLLVPTVAALPRLDVDCYTWHLTVCSGGSCSTQTCDQCDYYLGGEYWTSDVACY